MRLNQDQRDIEGEEQHPAQVTSLFQDVSNGVDYLAERSLEGTEAALLQDGSEYLRLRILS
jgi:hypothetical protein